MARKPIHLQACGKLTQRDRIWAAIRAINGDTGHGRVMFTLGQLADRIVANAPAGASARRIEETTIKSYIGALLAGGYLRFASGGAGGRGARDAKGQWRSARYALARDTGIEAPRVDRRGRPVQQGAAQENLWRAMHVLKAFDYRELLACAAASIAPATAKGYVVMLARAGYLGRLRPAKPGTPAAYRLARDTGPRAPQIQRVKHVYDPNLGQVVWHPGVNA